MQDNYCTKAADEASLVRMKSLDYLLTTSKFGIARAA